MKKRIFYLLLAVAILVSSLAIGLSAYAKTNNDIALDTIYIDTISGTDDMIWYTFTPEQSGTYAFLSYATGTSSNAYLFTRTTNDDGSRQYNQLAYAPGSDDKYLDYNKFTYNGTTYTHNQNSFNLTYHLDAGTKYYYAAGWSTSAYNQTMRARLTCVCLDSDRVITSVSATSSATLSAYTGGEWKNDSTGNPYYYYDISRIQTNMTVTITYNDGSTSAVKYSDSNTIDGYEIKFSQNQANSHWYAQNTDEYTANALTVTVGDVSYDYDVVINTSALYVVKGKVVDYIDGSNLTGATVSINNNVVATTNDGAFYFTYAAGSYKVVISYPNAIERTVTLNVDANTTANNDHTSTPYKLVTYDYVSDGIVNAKDYAYALKNKKPFDSKVTNFTTNSYNK